MQASNMQQQDTVRARWARVLRLAERALKRKEAQTAKSSPKQEMEVEKQ